MARLEFEGSETATILRFSIAIRRSRIASPPNSPNDLVARNDGSNIPYMPATSPVWRADHHACTRRSSSPASGASIGFEHATNADVSNAHGINRPAGLLMVIIVRVRKALRQQLSLAFHREPRHKKNEGERPEPSPSFQKDTATNDPTRSSPILAPRERRVEREARQRR
jgi:hypothetical protein